MRNIFKKVTIILFLMLMLFNNSFLLIISNAIDAIDEMSNNEEIKIKPVYELKLEKYVNYFLSDTKKGLMLQINLKTGTEYNGEQEYQPLYGTGINLNFPKINGEYPNQVEVIGISTKATNGSDSAKDFYQEYDKKEGKITIAVINEKDDNGNIYTEKVDNARDECSIIAYYGENCYVEDNTERELNITGNVIQRLYSDKEGKEILSEDIEQKYLVDKNISELISTNIDTTDIYDGFIYANSINGTNYRTEYIESVKLDIGYKEIADEINASLKNGFEKDGKVEETNEIVYKSTKINKQEVLDKLGEDGYFRILNKNGDILGEINKDTETNEDGIVEIKYEQEQTELLINISKPLNLGIINIDNTKEIKETMKNIENRKIVEIDLIKGINNIEIIDDESEEIIGYTQEEIYEAQNVHITDIKESETRIDLSVDNTEWTNNVQNEVNFIATLVTNDSKYSLFKNPVIEIQLPEEVEKVILDEVVLLYNENLKVKNIEIIEKNNNKIIRLVLNGIENSYNVNKMIEGINIIIPATVILKKDIKSVNTQMKLTYTNETGSINDYQRQEKEAKMYDVCIESINSNNVSSISLEKTNLEAPTVEELQSGLELKTVAKVGDKVLSDGDVVYEGQIIKYEVTVTNKLDKQVNGIKIIGQIPEGTVYGTVNIGTYWEGEYDYIKNENIKEYDFGISSVEANQSVTKFYEVIVKDLENSIQSSQIVNNIYLKNEEDVISSNEIKFINKKAEMVTFLKSYIGRDEKNSFHYWLYIKNTSNKVLNDVEIETAEFEKELIFKDSQLEGSVAVTNFGKFEDNKYKATIDEILPGEYATIKLFVNVGNFEDGINEFEEKLSFRAKTAETDIYFSNENRRCAYPEYITVTQTLDKEGEKVKPNTQLTYKVIIKNESKIRTQVNIFDFLPERVYGETATFEKWIFPDDDLVTTYDLEQEATKEYEREKTTINISSSILDKDGTKLGDIYYKYLFIPAGRTLEITFTAKAADVSEPTIVSNYMTVTGDYIHTKISNTVSCTIMPEGYDETEEEDNPINPDNPDIPDKPDNPDNPDIPNTPDDSTKTYEVSGLVWFDKNEDGKRDSESVLSGITVKIYDAENNTILKNEDGSSKVVLTDLNGEYKFSGIRKGNYLVLFEFDTSKYDVTKYQYLSVDEKFNSDVVLKKVTIDGIEKMVAITDVLNISSQDITNIDMGLIAKSRYDLKLEKTISKVTVTNGNGIKEYKYEGKKLAKIEIPAKQIGNTTIEIEYKITIINEGNVDAFVTEIIDYLPETLTLKNDDIWNNKANGTVSTTCLSGTKIAEGESKEIILVATKNLSSTALGRITNTAEIQSSFNMKNLSDIDSIEGNKNTEEDDYSEAEIIISVKTGIIVNIIIIFIIFLMIAIIFYLIYIKKIKIKNILKTCSIFLIIGVFININVVKADIDITGAVDEVNHIYPGSDGKNYICMDNGNAMCRIHYHWYVKSEETTDESKDEKERINNYINPSKDGNSVKFSIVKSNYRVGPYKVSWEKGSITKITGKYTTYNGKKKETHDITDSQITKSVNGNTAEIYFNLPITTIEVKDVRVDFYNEKGIEIKYEKKWRYIYKGTGITDDAHRAWHTTTQQRMKPADDWESKDDCDTYPVDDKVIFETKTNYGKIKIIKTDVDTKAKLSGAIFEITGGNAKITVQKTTDENGQILFDYLHPGTYTVTEVKAPSGYDEALQESVKTVEIESNKKVETINVKFKNRQYGDLSLIKVDKDTFDEMNGVGFIIFKEVNGTKKYIKEYKYKENEPATVEWTTNIKNAKYFYTGIQGETDKDGYVTGNCTSTKGMVLLKNLRVRDSNREKITYWAQEYKFDYDKNPELIYYRLDKTKTVKTKLITNAYDKNSSNEHKISLLNRVTKQFYTSDYIKEMIKEKDVGTIVESIYSVIMGEKNSLTKSFKNTYKTSLNNTKTSDGYYDTSIIGNMIDEIYDNSKNKTALEARAKSIFSSNDNIKKYRDLLFSGIGIKDENVKDSMKKYCYYGLKSQTMLIMKNKQYTIDIRGYVWEDISTKKTSERNDLCKDNTDDYADVFAKDVTVRLYAELNQQGQLPTLTTLSDEDGYKFKGAEFVLDSNGNKVLDDNGDPKIHYNIIINNLANYYIEFEYNGLKYQCVYTEKEKYGANENNYMYKMENTSKAKEKENDRTNLNNSFATIVGGESSTVTNNNKGTTVGYSRDINGNLTNKLIYQSENYQSTLLSNEDKEYNVTSVQNKIIPIGNSTGVIMKADTKTASCNFEDMYNQLPEGTKEISDVNLGIYERKQADLAIVTDIDNIEFNINGYTHKYGYQNRNQYISNGIPDIEINSGYNSLLDGFSVGVKNKSGDNYNRSYTREIYDSYIAFTKENENNENKLKVFVTYKLVVKNESSVISKVSLRNYADERYESIVESKIDGTDINVKWIKSKESINGNNVWETDGHIDKYIEPGQCITVYVKYEVGTDTIVELAQNSPININKNVTEITSYSTYNINGNGKYVVYGGIDKDSAPQNITYDKVITYEDDTDTAPDLKFERKSSKTISGLVFEDSTENSTEVATNNERKGNGTYENGENAVQNVEVKLLCYNNGDVAKLYTLDDNNEVAVKNAQSITNQSGKYTFEGLIPGEYYLQYTYGEYKDYENKNRNTEIINGNDEKSVNPQEYKSTIVNKDTFGVLIENNIENENGYKNINADFESKKNESALWYWYQKSENYNKSSAVDNWTQRQDFNNYYNTINYEKTNGYYTYNIENDSNSDVSKYHYMVANTGIMDVAVEEYKNQTTQLDYKFNSKYDLKFGIVERPRQKLELYKDISYIKLKLANGQILVEGNPKTDEIRYVTYPEGGILKIEVDSEIIEGATLDVTFELKVKNNSELDYNTREYYVYGNIGTATPVVTNINTIIDYMDENLKTKYTYSSDDSSTGVWHIVSDKSNSSLDGIKMDSKAYTAIKNNNNVLIINNPKLKGNKSSLLPGEEGTINVEASKLLSTSEEMVYENKAELFTVYNAVGRFYGQEDENVKITKWKLISPGNYDISAKPLEIDENNKDDKNRLATVTIVPPTGIEDIITYVLLGVGCLIILSGGIILIKKKVLD